MLPSNRTKSTGTPAENPKQAPKLLGTNKYKLATAAQDHQRDNIEAAFKAIATSSKNQKEDQRITSLEQQIASIAQSQHEANEALKKVLAGQGETKKFVKELTKKVKYNKKQVDKDHKIMTDAMKIQITTATSLASTRQKWAHFWRFHTPINLSRATPIWMVSPMTICTPNK
jgi:hypothetical protein